MAHRNGAVCARVAVVAGLALMWGWPAVADEVAVEASITAVTVFPDRAEVTRTVQVDLAKGEHEIVLKGLPDGLDARSIRVDGEGTGKLELGAVKVTRKYLGDEARRAEEQKYRDQLQALRDKDQALQDRITALDAQRSFIAGIGGEYPKVMSEHIREGDIKPSVWAQAWTQIGSGMVETLKKIQEARIARRDLQQDIRKAQDAYNRFASGAASRVEAALTAEAGSALKAKLTLSYQVPGASWRPVYDARLETGAHKVTLAQKAEVQQSTGEDWSGVRLTLSTAQPAIGAERPELDSWFVDVARPRPAGGLVGSGARAYRHRATKAEGYAEEAAPPPPPPAPSPEPVTRAKAAIQATDFTAQYRIVGRVDVPSDGSAKTFPVSERKLKAAYSVYATPKLGTRAYLVGEMTYKGDDPLPGGEAAIFRDGAFIGNGTVDTVRPGETFKLSFGIDDRVQIDYRKLADKRSSQGLLGGEKRITRKYRIKVTNRHKEAMPITIEDQVPVAQDERIRVSLTRDTTKITKRDPDDRKGVIAWTETYKPGAKKTITFGYFVQYPNKLSVEGL